MSDYIPWIIFAAASIAFWLSVKADASSSIGMKEKTAFFRGPDGKFVLKKYLLTMGALYAGLLIIPLIGQSTLMTITSAALLVVAAVLRFRQAGKNRKLRKAAGL